MRSRLAFVLAAFAAGVCALQASPALVPHAALVAPAMAALAVWRARRRARGATVAIVVCAAVVGVAFASWRAELRLADALDPGWEGSTLTLTGVIDGLPAAGERGTRFAFAVESVAPPSARVPGRVSLAWFEALDGDDDASEVPTLHAGERWRLRVRLSRPHGNVNPGGFDLEAWLLQHNLRATGYVVRGDDNARVSAFAGRFTDVVQRTRERVRDRLLRDLDGAPYAGVIVALAIGDQRAIPDGKDQMISKLRSPSSSARNAMKLKA